MMIEQWTIDTVIGGKDNNVIMAVDRANCRRNMDPDQQAADSDQQAARAEKQRRPHPMRYGTGRKNVGTT